MEFRREPPRGEQNRENSAGKQLLRWLVFCFQQTVSAIAPIHLSLCFDVLTGTKHPTAARCHSLHIPTYSYIFLRIPPTYLLPYRVAYQFPTYLHCSHIKKTRLADEKKFASISPITRSSGSCFSFRSTGFLDSMCFERMPPFLLRA